jgi:hypothetical protein
MRWHYFDKNGGEIAGFAEIRLFDNGKHLTAELQHLRRNYEDDEGNVHPSFTESFYLHAEKTGLLYNITKIALDGEEYGRPARSVIELGLSLFHARALDISIRMVERSFNKQDILEPVAGTDTPFKNIPVRAKEHLKKDGWGMVVPFRPRQTAGLRLG